MTRRRQKQESREVAPPRSLHGVRAGLEATLQAPAATLLPGGETRAGPEPARAGGPRRPRPLPAPAAPGPAPCCPPVLGGITPHRCL